MQKIKLFTPGPTMVPPEVTVAMAEPFDHHRTQAHRKILQNVTRKLQYVFQTKADCLVITGSGTAAMEAGIVGVGSPSSKALVVCGGKFSERWAKVCHNFGIKLIAHELEWGYGATAETVAGHLGRDKSIDTVIITHSETSTAAVSDVEAIAKITREHDCLLVVDGITSVGAIPVKMDEWGIDVLVCSSQKALMTPPGLGVIAVNERAWKRIQSFSPPAYYLRLQSYVEALQSNDSPYTPAITLVKGLNQALSMIEDEGIENIWRRTRRLAEATRAAMQAINLEVFAKHPVDSLTAIVLPESIDEPTFRRNLRERFGYVVAGGQGHLKGRIFRVNHMGYVDESDTLGLIGAIELLLHEMGHKFHLGNGPKAAISVLSRTA
jgi:aspartate aminotransferase-like enzyme